MADDWRPAAAKDVLWLDDLALDGADFSGRRLRILSVAGSRLVRCDFRRIRATGAGLGDGPQRSEYVECVFDGARLKDVMPGRATFVSCSFRDVRIETMFCHDAEFIDCVFSGVLKRVVFFARPVDEDEVRRVRNEYRGNDFSQARLDDVGFRYGVDLDQQKLPGGRRTSIFATPPGPLPGPRPRSSGGLIWSAKRRRYRLAC